MNYPPSFTAELWERAPQYRSPGNHELTEYCDTIVLEILVSWRELLVSRRRRGLLTKMVQSQKLH